MELWTVGPTPINLLDGQSVLPLLSDNKNINKVYTKETHYCHYPFNAIYNSPYEPFPLTPHSAIRDGDYKLIFDWYGRLRLYNIEDDPFEKNDLAVEMPELKDELSKKLMKWIKGNVQKRYWPTLNPEYNPQQESRDTPFLNLFSPFLKNQ